MERITIERCSIAKFKNLINREFDFSGHSVVLKGKNGIGKSNVLNAMYWCLTGVDLNDSSSTEDFIPKQLRGEVGEVINVEVTLNVGKIRRVVERTSKGLTESLFINDVPCETLKQGEIDIDNMLGLLPYTLSTFTNKDFVMRRFALNPNYIYSLTPKAIRDVLIKRYSVKCDPEFIKSVLDLPLVKAAFTRRSDANTTFSYQTLCSAISRCETDLKQGKIHRDDVNVSISVVGSIHDVDVDLVLSKLNVMVKGINDDLNAIESDLKVLQTVAVTFEQKFCEFAKSENPIINFEFLATNSRGIIKPTLEITSNDVDVKFRSTSESIYDAINMVDEYFSAVGFGKKLPLFIDRAESMNLSKLYNLALTERQFFAAQVRECHNNEIEVEYL